MTKKYHGLYLYLTIASTLLILNKRVKLPTLFSVLSVSLYLGTHKLIVILLKNTFSKYSGTKTRTRPTRFVMLKTCLWSGICPIKWKNVNFVPIHKKGNSLLPICEKVFASMLYETMFNFFF